MRMNKITNKERTEKNNIVCPNCHINIKILTDDLFLPMGDEWHDDMYISHEDEYLERKELQHKLDVIKQYIYNHALCFNGEIETDLDVEECKDLVHYIDTNSFDREVEDE